MAFIWLADTRPPAASCPAPVSPPGSVNQARCAGTFISVRTQMFSLLASALSFSINSRALTGGRSPACDALCFAATVMHLLRAFRCDKLLTLWMALGYGFD